jgi:type IV pilus assembly protein PilW
MNRKPLEQKTAVGFSLIELMLAVLLGSMAIAGALQLFIHSRTTWQAATNLAILEEKASYALTALEHDVRMTGNWNLKNDGNNISRLASAAAHCAGRDVSDWALNTTNALSASDDGYALPCPPRSASAANTDTLTLRFASAASTLTDARYIQLINNQRDGSLYRAAIAPELIDNPTNHTVHVRAWYLNTSSSEQNSAALFRYTLTTNGVMQNQEMVPGVEDFQVSLGVDRDNDGAIDGFIDPETAVDATVKAVRLWVLVRSMLPEPGHRDSGPWKSVDGNTTTAFEPQDSYRRIAVERTVWLRNPVLL